jgi:KDO2-lipid IV(A) lauroyltransferase
MTRRAVWLFETVLFITLSIPLAIMPLRFSMKVGEMLGLLLFYLWRSRRNIAIKNLKDSELAIALANSELPESIVRKNFKNIGKSFIEIIKIFYGLDKKIINSVYFDGIENLKVAESKGRGVLFITGHCGNWELMALVMSVKLKNIAVVARPLNNPYINRLVENMRERYGNSVIYKQGALKPIMQTFKNNGYVGILMDQAVLADEGYVIDFLGRGAWTTKMPALIARKTGASVIPVFIHRTNGNHTIKLYPEVELSKNNDRETAVIEDTKRFSEYIERYIQEHPSEWLWIHRRWKRV